MAKGSPAGLVRVPNIGAAPVVTFTATQGSSSAPGIPQKWYTLANTTQKAFLSEAKGFRNWTFYITGDGTALPVTGGGVYVWGTLDSLTVAGTNSNWFLLGGEVIQGGTGNETNPMSKNGDMLEFDKPLFAVAFSLAGTTGVASGHPISVWASAVA